MHIIRFRSNSPQTALRLQYLPEAQKFHQLMKRAGEWMTQAFKEYIPSGGIVIKPFDTNASKEILVNVS